MYIAKSRVPVLLAALFLVFSSQANAGGKTELPADLDAVPRNAVGFLHVRLADVWRSDVAKELRYLVDKAGPETWKDFEKRSPINPALLDRLTIVMLTPNEPFPSAEPDAHSALFIVSTSKPFERSPLIEALGAKEKVYREHLYYFNEELWSGLVIVDERTFLIGSEATLVRYFDTRRRKDGAAGPLQAPLVAAAGKHLFVIGLNPSTLPKEGPLPPAAGTLLSAYSGTMTLDLEPMLRFQARLDFADEAKAKDGEAAARQMLELGRQGLQFPIGELEKILKDPEKGPVSDLPKHFASLVGLGFLREVDAQLKDAPLKREGASVKLPLEYKSHAAMPALVSVYGSFFAIGVSARSTFARVDEKIDGKDPTETHLRTLAKAMEDYRKKHGAYPPAALRDKDGRPTLSWRVALLPYLGEETLYKEFKLDEPWDSLHNQRLIKKLPKALQVTERDRYSYYYDRSAQWKTKTQVITGPNTLFEGPKGIAGLDKERKTILLAHLSTDGVYWTKPADVVYAADKPLPNFYGKYQDRMQVLLTDGTYRSIDRSMNEKDIRALIERSDKPKEAKTPKLGELESIWDDLARNDEAGTKKAWQGIAAMSKMPARAVPFLKERVKAVPHADAKMVAQLLIEIDSNVFRTRTLAHAKLKELGELAHPAIEKKLAEKSRSLETTRLLRELADQAKTVLTGEELQRLRAVEILEQAGTPDARAVLADLARGADGVVLSEQARRALARLSRNDPK